MLNLVKHTNNSKKIIQDGYSLLLVSHVNELLKEDLSFLDGIIINTESNEQVLSIISKIRTHVDIRISLKPVFINAIYSLPKNIAIHLDGQIELSMISTYMQRVITINKRVLGIEKPRLLSNDLLIQYKTMAYLNSRNIQLSPIVSRESLIGYEFPFISLFYKKTEVVDLLKNLQKAVDKNYLSFKLQDFIHLCKSCSGNYLNFRECCPNCNSIDIEAHDMVHHFVCAHVAPEKDFKKEDSLECPKCDKNLRHIGIDYDKPSTIYGCKVCNHEFQNPGMSSLCIDCGTENKLEELLQKSIGNYGLTQTGEHLLLEKGVIVDTNGIDHSQHCSSLSTDLFKILLSQEIKRINITSGSSFFVSIKFYNDQLELLNNDAKHGLKVEISQIINSYLKDSDILSSEGYNKYYAMLPETNENQLDRLGVIEYNLSKLLSDNLKTEKQKIEVYIKKINKEDEMKDFFV